MKRLLALVVAVGLVLGAIAIRGWASGDSGDEAGTGNEATPDGAITIVCDADLEAVCHELELSVDDVTVRVEEAAVTAEALSQANTGAADVDGWLVSQPWPGMVAERRDAAGQVPVLGSPSAALAVSPGVMVMDRERQRVLAANCGGEITWECVGEVAGDPWPVVGGEEAWGEIKPGEQPPDTSAGLLILGQAASSFFGTSDFASNDFSADPAFRPWFEKLARSVPDYTPPAGTPLQQFLVIPASYDVVGALEAQAGPAVASSRDRDRLTIAYPSPMLSAEVVLVPTSPAVSGESLVERLGEERLGEVLAGQGWRVQGISLAEGLDPDIDVGDSAPLPGAGVLDALRSLWIEVVR
ncbi:MAG: hypothetical protein JJLCMIEE_00651 [Acidimicrobiales bacterium]|nr:MAG: hypothetical protein EDR02_02265 [Actinomycetota bacterium]MBV6507601.1 hypothetical protein [Acidimicrobiales bacterium]